MSEKQFRITTNPKSNAVAFDEKQKKHYIGIDLEDLLNEQQAMIRRDEMSIKTMMSNMKKLEEANDNMNLFIKQTIEPLLFNCVFELNTIESMSQVELAEKIENETIPFIQNFKYLKYESPEEEKQDKSE